MTSFNALGLTDNILHALRDQNYTNPTPIQSQAIPVLMRGTDLMGIAQTGTGKTAAFSLPILHQLLQMPRPKRTGTPNALILSPTRELAQQICDSIQTYSRHTRLRCQAVYGGVPIRRQISALKKHLDILVATPGRLVDLHNQHVVDLGNVRIFTLDEADRMLDMGFVNEVKRIAKLLPGERQTIMFSATMPKQIAGLADSLLRDPEYVSIAPAATTAERIEQSVMFVERQDKKGVLHGLLSENRMHRVLVFTRTKHRADQVATFLSKKGISTAAIHGNKSQNARQRALQDFKSSRIKVLVATDIAARGIDVDDVSHVINFELPDEAENYVHRIGRTARGASKGAAVTLCASDEMIKLKDIQKTIRMDVPTVEGFEPTNPIDAKSQESQPSGQRAAKRRRPKKNRRRTRSQKRLAA